jgi:hypothetical protein
VQIGSQLYETTPVVSCLHFSTDHATIPCHQKDILPIGGQAVPSLPDGSLRFGVRLHPAACTVFCYLPHRQCVMGTAWIIREYPPVVRVRLADAGVCYVQLALQQKKSRAVQLVAGVEVDLKRGGSRRLLPKPVTA